MASDLHLFFMGPLNVGSNGFGAPAKKKICYSDQSRANTVEVRKAEVHRSRKMIKEERNSKERKGTLFKRLVVQVQALIGDTVTQINN